MPDLIDAVSRGVMLSGALPISCPTISIHEAFSHPTSMYPRNLMAIDTEEMIRAQPMDATITSAPAAQSSNNPPPSRQGRCLFLD